MKNVRWSQLLLMALLSGLIMSGCGRGIFNSEPFTDTTKDIHGQSVAADTARNWQEWREEVDPQLAAEAVGKKPPGFSTWSEKWTRQLLAIEKTQQNAQKYIAYIIESRRRAGLPELEGYP